MKHIVARLFLEYLRLAARLQLLKNKPVIIGVTGSAGKTSLKQAIQAALTSLPSLKVCGYVNSESGIPLDILGLTITTYSYREWILIALRVPIQLLTHWERYTHYLVEMGIDSPNEPKNMSYLLKIIQPTIGVLLNAFPMHSEPFDYLVTETDEKIRQQKITELIANEKGRLLTSLPQHGLAVFNIDQKEIANIARTLSTQKTAVGASKNAHIICTKTEYKNDSTIFSFIIKNDKKNTIIVTLKNQLLPTHFAQTIACAIAVGYHITKDIDHVIANIENNFSPPPSRSSLFAGVNGSTIFDSSYNTSRKTLLDSLQLLKKTAKGKKIAILGDMRELGQESRLEHETIALKAAEILDMAVLVGPEMKKYVLPILENKQIDVTWFSSAVEAANYLKPKLKKDDMVLVKGSQNTLLLEIAVEELLANEADVAKLCRRGEYWDKRRAELTTDDRFFHFSFPLPNQKSP